MPDPVPVPRFLLCTLVTFAEAYVTMGKKFGVVPDDEMTAVEKAIIMLREHYELHSVEDITNEFLRDVQEDEEDDG